MRRLTSIAVPEPRVDGWTEGRVQLCSRHPAHCAPAPNSRGPDGAASPSPLPIWTLLPVWPLAPGAPAGWRTGRPLRGGGLNELVCTPSCPADRRLAQGLGDGCRAVLGGPGCARPGSPPAPTQGLRTAGLQVGVAKGGSGLPWASAVAGPWAGGGPLVRHPAVGGPGMAEAGGWKAEPPTPAQPARLLGTWARPRQQHRGPGIPGPGHVLDSSTGAWDPGTWARPRQQHRGLGSLPGPVVNSGNGGRTGSRPSCFVCGGKGGGQEGPVADGLCPVPARGA